MQLKQFGQLTLIWLVLVALSACSFSDTATSNPTPSFSGAPVVKLASPLPNDVYQQGASVQILGRIENAGTDIQSIEILLDNQSIGSQAQPNVGGASAFTITNSWSALTEGNHIVTLRATRADGTLGETSVNFVVNSSAQVVNVPSTATPDLGLPTPVKPADLAPTATLTVEAQQVAPTATVAAVVAPTNTSVPPTSSAPQVLVISGANVRSGPGVVFNPPIGSLSANATAPIVGISPDRQWYKIQYYNATAWISAQTVSTTGDLTSLPIDAGPATPIPQPTAVPTTAVTATTAATAVTANTDLSITLLSTSPDPIVCNEAATVTVVVTNTGSTQSIETTVLVTDLYNNNAGQSASTVVKALGQNESVQVSVVMTINNNFAEGHTLRARIDPDNKVPETNETNNDNNKTYTLATGGC